LKQPIIPRRKEILLRKIQHLRGSPISKGFIRFLRKSAQSAGEKLRFIPRKAAKFKNEVSKCENLKIEKLERQNNHEKRGHKETREISCNSCSLCLVVKNTHRDYFNAKRTSAKI
jgi:hypothetical protein